LSKKHHRKSWFAWCKRRREIDNIKNACWDASPYKRQIMYKGYEWKRTDLNEICDICNGGTSIIKDMKFFV